MAPPRIPAPRGPVTEAEVVRFLKDYSLVMRLRSERSPERSDAPELRSDLLFPEHVSRDVAHELLWRITGEGPEKRYLLLAMVGPFPPDEMVRAYRGNPRNISAALRPLPGSDTVIEGVSTRALEGGVYGMGSSQDCQHLGVAVNREIRRQIDCLNGVSVADCLGAYGARPWSEFRADVEAAAAAGDWAKVVAARDKLQLGRGPATKPIAQWLAGFEARGGALASQVAHEVSTSMNADAVRALSDERRQRLGALALDELLELARRRAMLRRRGWRGVAVEPPVGEETSKHLDEASATAKKEQRLASAAVYGYLGALVRGTAQPGVAAGYDLLWVLRPRVRVAAELSFVVPAAFTTTVLEGLPIGAFSPMPEVWVDPKDAGFVIEVKTDIRKLVQELDYRSLTKEARVRRKQPNPNHAQWLASVKATRDRILELGGQIDADREEIYQREVVRVHTATPGGPVRTRDYQTDNSINQAQVAALSALARESTLRDVQRHYDRLLSRPEAPERDVERWELVKWEEKYQVWSGQVTRTLHVHGPWGNVTIGQVAEVTTPIRKLERAAVPELGLPEAREHKTDAGIVAELFATKMDALARDLKPAIHQALRYNVEARITMLQPKAKDSTDVATEIRWLRYLFSPEAENEPPLREWFVNSAPREAVMPAPFLDRPSSMAPTGSAPASVTADEQILIRQCTSDVRPQKAACDVLGRRVKEDDPAGSDARAWLRMHLCDSGFANACAALVANLQVASTRKAGLAEARYRLSRACQTGDGPSCRKLAASLRSDAKADPGQVAFFECEACAGVDAAACDAVDTYVANMAPTRRAVR